jgi:hypothetical protein
MRIELPKPVDLRRGVEPEVGMVYQNPHGRPFYKLIVGMAEVRKFNRVVMIHVNAMGEVVGCSQSPVTYVRDHHDLVGRVKDMPSLKIEWNRR